MSHVHRTGLMDALPLLLNRFAISAGVFHTGQICGVHAFEVAGLCRDMLHRAAAAPQVLRDGDAQCRGSRMMNSSHSRSTAACAPGSSSAFIRAFVRKVGMPPTQWLRQRESAPHAGGGHALIP